MRTLLYGCKMRAENVRNGAVDPKGQVPPLPRLLVRPKEASCYA